MPKGKYVKKVVPKTTANITQGIINFLNEKGHKATRINRTGIFDPSTGRWRKSNTRDAVLDIFCCLAPGGRTLWVDVKNGRDELSEAQIEYMLAISDCGGLAFAAESVQHFEQLYYEDIEPHL